MLQVVDGNTPVHEYRELLFERDGVPVRVVRRQFLRVHRDDP